jgi:hypothetical protein
MNTRIVIKETQADLLSEIQKVGTALQAIPQAIVDIGQTQAEQLSKLLGQVRDTLNTKNPVESKEAQSWLNKVSAGVGFVVNIVALATFLTGVATVPAAASLAPGILGTLSSLYRRITVRSQ